jgi:hypothetical protein
MHSKSTQNYVIVSSIANEFLFLSQIVFTCNTPRSWSRFNERKDKVGTLLLVKIIGPQWKQQNKFVHKILLPYLHIQISQLRSQEIQRMAWLLYYWSVHKSHEFLDWMKQTHPTILGQHGNIGIQAKELGFNSPIHFTTLSHGVLKLGTSMGLSEDKLWLVPWGQPSVVPRWDLCQPTKPFGAILCCS